MTLNFFISNQGFLNVVFWRNTLTGNFSLYQLLRADTEKISKDGCFITTAYLQKK